jgi:hypothetical protein
VPIQYEHGSVGHLTKIAGHRRGSKRPVRDPTGGRV